MSVHMQVSAVYPSLIVAVPDEGEWIEFYVVGKRLYWRICDGDPADPDVVDYCFISHHKSVDRAEEKRDWLNACLKPEHRRPASYKGGQR